MSDFLDKIGLSVIKTQEQSLDLLEKLIATARPTAVFGQPVTGGDYTVINVAEVSCGMGVGFGGGGGTGADDEDQGIKGRHDAVAPTEGDEGLKSRHDILPPTGGYGIGGGGGGFSTARPVAAISIGPDGVHIEPVVDVTKIGLAFFTTLGAMALMFSNMRKCCK
jgi:uncharacterized spore protein YtfJ